MVAVDVAVDAAVDGWSGEGLAVRRPVVGSRLPPPVFLLPRRPFRSRHRVRGHRRRRHGGEVVPEITVRRNSESGGGGCTIVVRRTGGGHVTGVPVSTQRDMEIVRPRRRNDAPAVAPAHHLSPADADRDLRPIRRGRASRDAEFQAEREPQIHPGQTRHDAAAPPQRRLGLPLLESPHRSIVGLQALRSHRDRERMVEGDVGRHRTLRAAAPGVQHDVAARARG